MLSAECNCINEEYFYYSTVLLIPLECAFLTSLIRLAPQEARLTFRGTNRTGKLYNPFFTTKVPVIKTRIPTIFHLSNHTAYFFINPIYL